MVNNISGLYIGLPELCRHFLLSLKSTELENLIRITQRLGFFARAFQVGYGRLWQVGLVMRIALEALSCWRNLVRARRLSLT